MPKRKQKTTSVRLATHITPKEYTVTLEPDLEAHTFSGEETIHITLDKPTAEITLHSKDLEIISAMLHAGKTFFPVKKIIYNDKQETVTFIFPKRIPKGLAQLQITFRGVLASNMRGFYKSKYMVGEKEAWMATTQFEATDARRCIPCFDEPTHKAIFHINLVIPKNKTAISNTLPMSEQIHRAGYKIVSFAPTPKMSTYLLAFIVGDFEWIQKKTKSGVLVRIMTVPGKKHQGKFALDVTVRCLEFYEDYFNIPYPLNTLDMIAIPDFSSLAMENWGAITFREIGLLVDDEHTSSGTKERVAEVIAHELAHQWFGNLVTMEWWTHLWLNEGFASYIPYLALDTLFPKWNIWDRFATDTQSYALHLDGLKHTHPIEVDVHHPNEIGEIFDAVSYSKGASVIRMLADYLGPDTFRVGLTYYLKKHSYQNASTIHLWEAFEKVSKKPIKKMMALWTSKSGYPYVEVAEKGNTLTFSQTRYFGSETSLQKSEDTTLWYVPLALATDRGVKQLPLMTGKTCKVSKPESLWMKVNAHESGLYRSAYSPLLLERLTQAIESERLSAVDRLGVIRDLFSFAQSGVRSTTDALGLLSAYKNETEYIVWVEICTGLRAVSNLLLNTKSEEPFKQFARVTLKEVGAYVGWEKKTNESHSDGLLRSLILGSLVSFGDERTIAQARKRFKNRKNQPLIPDLRGVIYGAVARIDGEKEYRELLSMYRKETLHEEKNRLLSALGQFRTKKLLGQTLTLIMSEEVRMQDRNGGFASVLINPVGRELGWIFVKKNWNKIGEAYGDGNHLLSRLIGVLSRHTTRKAYRDIKQFFKTHKAPAAERTIEQTLEQIDAHTRWLARDEKRIEKWLKVWDNEKVIN